MNAAGRTKPAQRPDDPGSSVPEPRSSAVLRDSTGRDRGDWFALLDAWGAVGLEYREIADFLTGEHGVSNWWAQKLIVEYEQARGQRAPGARPDGTFAAGASKTVAVPVERLFRAFIDADVRDRWLPGAGMRERTSQPGRSVRFDWEEDSTRVNVNLVAASAARSQVAVEHEHLPDAKTAEERKVFWRARLATLKDMLEG
jgi:hypothetical protein